MKPFMKNIVKLQCSKCDKSFNRSSDLTRHTDSVHDGIRYTCNSCYKQFSRVASLKHHQRTGNCKLKLGDADIVSIIPLRNYLTEEGPSFNVAANPFSQQDQGMFNRKRARTDKPSSTFMRPMYTHPPIKKEKRELDTCHLSDSSSDSSLCRVTMTLRISRAPTLIAGGPSTSKTHPPPPTPTTDEQGPLAYTATQQPPLIDLTTPNLSPASYTSMTDDKSICYYITYM